MQETQLPTDHNLSCASFRALVEDVAFDASDEVTVARAEAHAAQCASCRLALAAARGYRRAMSRIGDAVRATESLRERALHVLRGVRGSRTN